MSLNVFAKPLHAWTTAQGGLARALSYPRLNTGSGGGSCRGLFLAPAGTARGLVVVAHATGNDLYFPSVQAFRWLLQAGYAVFAFDLDGHGLGSSHLLSREHVDSMLPRAIVEARRCLPGGPLYLLGQSLGGLLCLRYLAQPQEHAVSATVLLATPVSGRILSRPLGGELLAAVSGAFWRALPTYGLWHILPAVGAFKRSHYPLRFAPGEGGAKVSDYGGFVDDLVAQSAAPITAAVSAAPCLFLYGSHDALTPAAQATQLAAGFGKRSALEVIPGDTHFTLVLRASCIERTVHWFSEHDR